MSETFIQGWIMKVETMGQDNGLDVSPSWQELKDERDVLRADKRMAEWRDQRWRTQILAKECKTLKAERDAAMKERDIHAANLSAIRIALGVLHAAGREDDAEVAAANLERVIEGAGDAQHMANLKAQWQAEALEHHAQKVAAFHLPGEMISAESAHDVLMSEARRRQAEEPTE